MSSRTCVIKKSHKSLFPFTMALFIYVGLCSLKQTNWNSGNNCAANNMPNKGYWAAMPPAPKVPLDDAVAVVKQFIDYFRTPTLPAWSDNVWQEMSDTLKRSGLEWTSQCVYTNVKCDRRRILSLAREQMGISVQTLQNCNTLDFNETEPNNNTDETEDGTNSFTDSPQQEMNISTKYMVLTEDEWQAIKPTDEQNLALHPKVWTNVVADAMWYQYRLPCAFIFKRARVRTTPDESQYVITFTGQCKSKTCQNPINGRADKKIEEDKNGITFAIKTRDTRGENHEIVKRPFNGKRRQEAYKDLKFEGCTRYRKCEARKAMLPGDIEPPILPNNNVCRQAKKEGIDKDLGIDKREGRDIVRSIEDMCLSSQHAEIIREVAGFPFHVIYGSKGQFHVYQEYRRLTRNWFSIAVDATGSLVNRLQRKNGTKSGHIFLYAIVINFHGTTACVFQMLSERHDSVTIMSWLLRWIQSGAPPPKEAVCDYSRALLMGLSMAFNKKPIKEYIRERFEAVSNCSRIAKEPVTFIRIDVAHFIHMVCRWKSFQNLNQRAIKDFYLRCVALMVECDALEKFKRVFVFTCTVALQSHEDSTIDVEDAKTPKDARRKLENLISRGKVMDDSTVYDQEEKRDTPFRRQFVEGDSDDDGEPDIDVVADDTCIGEWIDSLMATAKKTVSIGENLNPFFLPNFIERFAAVAKEFPLWTAVGMPPNTKRATSSYIEEFFKDLKKSTFKHYTLPIAVDKFVREQARDIDGTNCIISSKMVQYNNDRLHKNNVGNEEVVSATNSEIIVDSINTSVHNSKEVNGADILAVKDFENSIDVSSIGVEEVDPDLLAIENWGGKVGANNMNDYANTCKTNCDSPTKMAVIDQISSIDEKNENGMHFDGYVLVSDRPELRYSDFELNLNRRVGAQSSIVEFASTKVVEQPLEKKVAKSSKYFKAFPEIQHQNALVSDKRNTQLKNAELLQNGSRCPAVVMEGRTYYLRNTCPFDSMIQILATAAIDNIEYRQFVQSSQNSTLKFVCNFITKGVTKNLLVDRARILADFCIPKPQMGIENKVIAYEIDAENNIANTVRYTLSSNPSVYDIEKCPVCIGRTIAHVLISPNHNTITKKGFKALEQALEFWTPLYNVNCRNGCSGKLTRIKTPNEQVFIELDVRHHQNINQSLTCLLGDFPVVLRLGPKDQATSSEYRLAGVVEHLPGHYVAHCMRIGGHWQKFNSMDRKVMSSNMKTCVEPHLAIYVRRSNKN